MANYQIPGVYVTQSGTSLTTTSTTPLNVAIVADQVTLAADTDTFNNVVATSGIIIGTLSQPMVITASTGNYASYSGYTVTWVSGTTTVTGVYGVNFTVSTPSGSAFSSLTTSGTTSGIGLPSGTVSVTYAHQWGAYGTYGSFNSVANALGTAVNGTVITNPAVLAAQFAFQNGANTVQILPVARVSSSGQSAASVTDWARTFAITSSGVSSDPTYLANFNNIDTIVPLYSFVNSAGQATTSVVSSGINTYLNAQQTIGINQRAFIGVDGTAGQITSGQLQTLAASFSNVVGQTGSTRVTLAFPGSINYNPGLNSTTGLSNVNFNIPGYYLAAALAGLFVGQPTVATPITNKIVAGFNAIGNPISLNDAQTNYLPYGITTVYQKRDGNLWVLQGLTTNVTSWLTKEISLNAIGDVLSNNVANDLNKGYLIGGPLTQNTLAGVLGTVQGTLINAIGTNIIQSYQNLSYSVNPASPTTVNVTFQYSPTYPINYIQVTLSLNTQTGTIITTNQQSNLAVY
jgi:hypothetical protein